ncbi:hypothetical protein [Nocardioides lijunqiniae]|uniref:hypothetical protein n=1 Tax=Nocardioides lijunqiniae TaxID=2760832 RepID=UPI001878933E|nr:hypothetical protein [Nocardioides lijunqiniae]
MKKTVSVLVAMAAGVAGVLASGAPAQAVDRQVLRPADLPRGADVRLPHLEGRTVVDGDVRVRVRGGDRVVLLGRSGAGYAVGVTARDDGRGSVRVVRPGAPARVVLKGVQVFEMLLSADGKHLTRAAGSTAEKTTVTVHRTSDGALVRQRTFPGSAQILDVGNDRMVIGSWTPNRTLSWNFATGTATTLVKRTGYAASIEADRLATFSRDPYDGGCSIVGRLAAPQTRLGRSCDERVTAFSPRGGRMATVGILSDGLGPTEVRLRRSNGRLVARYAARFFGAVVFESERALLLDTNGTKKAAVVRCTATRCVRASALRRTQTY